MGNMVKRIVNKTKYYFPGRYYNLEITAVEKKAQKFYFASGCTIAMRTINGKSDTMQ